MHNSDEGIPSYCGTAAIGHDILALPPNSPPLLAVGGRKQSSFQSKQRLKFVEWEKMHLVSIEKTIWKAIKSEFSDNTESLDEDIEYQLAKDGIFEEIEKKFAQRPTVKLSLKPTKDIIYILDSKKAYNLSKKGRRYRICVS